MRYEIKGETLPVVVCYLESGEKMITERGSMSWMSPNMEMQTTSNGGIGKSIWKSIFRRSFIPKYVHSTGRKWNDRICFKFSGIYQGISGITWK